ncbi:MAG: enoyl-CoA hydratase/isomerase family protein [Gammaproteobacteria bacterium]|nr:enoyl-CoA hydratase/isomerase family protein [Gammaproteobacteria bacterium]
MTPKLVKTELVEPYVALVTIDNPPVNAHSAEVLTELAWTFDTLSDRDDVRATVLTGAGKVFCAGADIKARAGRERQAGDHWQGSRSAREAYHSIRECVKPVIGALNGPALGGGLAIAASCDILVAAETACLGLPEINVGLLGGGRHAQRLFGHSRLRRMMLTGHRVYGPELYRLGVVEECVDPAALLDSALSIAREIAGKSPLAIKLAKHALNTIEEMSLRDGYRFEQTMTGELSGTEDSKEAMRAFVEKRQPRFKGR